MKTPSYLAVWIILVLAWTSAAAQSSSEEKELALVYGDTSTISIATGNEQSIRTAPSVASVITAQDIKDMGAIDLDQALESVPGLHVSKSHIASKPIYSFRGIETLENPEVLMLVNGIPITNVFQGDRSQIWGGMPLEDVERIEVIRGPGSALYGADAFAGVINIITKTAQDIHGTKFGVRAGSYNSRDIWMLHGGKLGSTDAAFYFRVGDTNGQRGIIPKDAVSASGPINEQRRAVDARADISKDAWRFRAAYQQRKIGSGAGLAGALDPGARLSENRLYLDLDYDQVNWAPDWDLSGVVGYYNIRQHQADPYFTLFPPGAIPGFPNGMIGNPGHAEQHTHASVSALYSGFEQHQVRIGAGLRRDDLYRATESKNFNQAFAPICNPLNPTNPNPVLPCTPVVVNATGNPGLVYLMPHSRNLAYAFVQDEWSFSQDWTLTAGVRHDRYSDFGGTTNPRIALVWDAAYNVVVKAMHGEAFRAPTFVEQYAINNPVQSGTPTIKPETIKTDELAFSWQATNDLQTSLNFFRYHIHNIIKLVGATMQNSGGQTGRGLELEAAYNATDSLKLTGNFSLQHSRDAATGQDAGMAPHREVYGRADWRFAPHWQLGTTVDYVASRAREPNDPRPPVPDYTMVNLNLRREKIANGWEVRGMVYNLFNRSAWEPTFKSSNIPSDLPLPGRTLFIQIQRNM